MNRKIKTLQKIYDNEVREKCETKRLKINNCFQDNMFEPENNCKHFIDSFQRCINNFNDEYNYKYSQMIKFNIYYK